MPPSHKYKWPNNMSEFVYSCRPGQSNKLKQTNRTRPFVSRRLTMPACRCSTYFLLRPASSNLPSVTATTIQSHALAIPVFWGFLLYSCQLRLWKYRYMLPLNTSRMPWMCGATLSVDIHKYYENFRDPYLCPPRKMRETAGIKWTGRAGFLGQNDIIQKHEA